MTLGAPTELTGKRFVLQNPDGGGVEYFSFLLYKPIETAATLGLQLLFPAQAWSGPLVYGLSITNIPRTNYVAIQNPNLVPVDVTMQTLYYRGSSSPIKGESSSQTIPGGAVWIGRSSVQLFSEGTINSSGPIRVLHLISQPGPYFIEALYPSPPMAIPNVEVTASPTSLSWQWQIGSPAPQDYPVEHESGYCFIVCGRFRRVLVSGCADPESLSLSAAGVSEPLRVGSGNLSGDDHGNPVWRLGSSHHDSSVAHSHDEPDASVQLSSREPELHRPVRRRAG